MKPNDKAIEAGFEACATNITRSIVRDIVTAAYAAQFKSEDYAGLIESLRQDISDSNGKLMSDWDSWRKYISTGGDGSWPRDQFEGHLDVIAEMQHSAADALEALLAMRNALLAVNAELSVAFKERDDAIAERDALLARLAPVVVPAGDGTTDDFPYRAIIKATPKAADVLEDLLDKREAARLAPVEASDNDCIEIGDGINLEGFKFVTHKNRTMLASGRFYIDTNKYVRLAPVEDEARHLTAEEQKVFHSALRRSAKIKKPVDDEALVEMAARTNYGKKWDDPENGPGEAMKEVWRNLYRKPLAAIRPHIEAAERERCAKAVETVGEKINVAHHERPEWEDGYLQGVHDVAAAIRSGK